MSAKPSADGVDVTWLDMYGYGVHYLITVPLNIFLAVFLLSMCDIKLQESGTIGN